MSQDTEDNNKNQKNALETPGTPAHVHGPHCSHRHQQDPFVRPTAKLGRNDPCHCGSNRKYKKCHGQNQ